MSSEEPIKEIFKKGWDKDTCYPALRKKWRNSSPEVGQCAITALIVHDIYGGEIAYNKIKNHFWNKLPSGKFVDLTKGQFSNPGNLKPDLFIERSEILNSKAAKLFETKNRYNLLKRRVAKELKLL